MIIYFFSLKDYIFLGIAKFHLGYQIYRLRVQSVIYFIILLMPMGLSSDILSFISDIANMCLVSLFS